MADPLSKNYRQHHDGKEEGSNQPQPPLMGHADEDGDEHGKDCLEHVAYTRPSGSLYLASISRQPGAEGSCVVLLHVVPTNFLPQHCLKCISSQPFGQVLARQPKHPALKKLRKGRSKAEEEKQQSVVDGIRSCLFNVRVGKYPQDPPKENCIDRHDGCNKDRGEASDHNIERLGTVSFQQSADLDLRWINFGILLCIPLP